MSDIDEKRGLERYGLKWTGPKDFVAKPMRDGYWTPWHIAQDRIATLEQQLEAARSEAFRLFGLLDDIDTAEDMFKPETTAHFSYVHKKHMSRHDGPISSDGHKLTWNDGNEK